MNANIKVVPITLTEEQYLFAKSIKTQLGEKSWPALFLKLIEEKDKEINPPQEMEEPEYYG